MSIALSPILFGALAATAVVAPQTPPAETFLVTDDGVTFELYPRSVRDSGRGLLIAEVMITLDTPMDDGFASAFQIWSFQCDKRTSQVALSTSFDADGETLKSWQDAPHPTKHEPVAENSAAGIALARACDIAGRPVGQSAAAQPDDGISPAQAERRLNACLKAGAAGAPRTSLVEAVVALRALCGAQIGRVKDHRVAAATRGLEGTARDEAEDQAIRALNDEIARVIANLTGLTA